MKDKKFTQYKSDDIKILIQESNAIENEHRPEALEDGIKSLWDTVMSLADEGASIDKINKAHQLAMQRVWPEIAGHLRRENVRVGLHIAPDYSRVAELLSRLVESSPSPETAEDIKAWHVEFERIHPFLDGNGRTGRILMCAQRIVAGLPLEIIYEKDKQNYYDWFL